MDIITVLGLSKSVGRRVAVQGGISINDIGLEMPDGLSIEVKEGEIVKFGRHSGAVYLGDGNIIRVTVEI